MIPAPESPPSLPVFTNDTRTGEVGPLREFRQIYEYRGFVWVEALNGEQADALREL